MTYVIIHALAPIFVIMLLGFWAGKTKKVDNQNVSLLNVFVMDFALPAALFSATVQTPWVGIIAQSPLLLILTLSMWITYAAVYFLSVKVFKKSPQDAAVLTLTVALPNYAALGLPILGSVLGEGPSTSLSVAVSIACGSVLLTPFCLLILEREKARAAGENQGSTLSMLPVLMWRSLKNPIVWGPLLGVILSAIGIKMPDLVLYALKPLGLAATAAALFLTGVILSARKLKINAVVILATLTKLLIQPAIAWVLVVIFGIQGPVAVTGVLMIALAAGFFGVVFGNRFGVQSPDAEAVLLFSSILSILSLPLFISLTSGM
ncbi:AEC family transporter [Shimwellia blattae]|uniref:Putative transport protein n=1 Tax=Shimwellia blattae (strain ATCC 29907 / DSM 4481 / JCM 1650 / NBRC 105725 / CDC 9005-74) TaxID=630626 RepID=I2BDH7_SHIBC|nr:AEC family transporter [Shimwellia blattae]AFJ48581.1 putative transport protein [Shimwellia blattae DSM 4481 = NBRC 105725]GAB81384.1 putative AEC family transporter [Shimwellia blattae DSM 4481 = NBRC 105725]VDY66070.1 putative transporter YfdV [Shimwellia blattae]VEC26850.1 putative transporter YfdV [Shimwellia blattae]